MPIHLYSMPGCGFCKKALEMFKDDIESGKIVVKKHTESGNKFKGFPSFENIENGQTTSGLPASKDSLFEKLGYVESNTNHVNQQHSNQPVNHHPNQHHVNQYFDANKDKSKGWSTQHFMMFILGLLLIIFIILIVSKCVETTK